MRDMCGLRSKAVKDQFACITLQLTLLSDCQVFGAAKSCCDQRRSTLCSDLLTFSLAMFKETQCKCDLI